MPERTSQYEINPFFMVEKNCPYCGKNKGLKITYNNKLDGTGQHIICTDCIDVFFKKSTT